MITKCIEVRDEGTCMPVLAIKMKAANLIEDRFLRRCGYPRDGRVVVLMHLSDQKASSNPWHFGGRTWPVAHEYIIEHFDELLEGAVVDVRVILSETDTPAAPEIYIAKEVDNGQA